MKHRLALILALICGINTLEARPVDVDKAKAIGQRFLSAKTDNKMKTNDLQLVYTGISTRNEACFFVFNSGSEGFVIVSADDRFRPIVGYSDEGPFETENMSPELAFYLDKVIEARTSRDAVLFDDTAEEWQSVAADGTLPSRNGGRGVDYICQTKWNQDSPYNYYAPEASSGPNGRCYAGCVATAMSQVMKRWDHPTQGTGSHAYNCHGYGRLEAHFGETTYDWEHMPDRLGGNSTQEEIEAVALLMYHCGVAVNMGFSPNGSGANSFDVPRAIKQYFSYSGHAVLRDRDAYSLDQWQDLLKETFDLGWPVYYSGFSETAGHAFVCDGYDDNDLFHFNWGWGGSSDGWFVIDEIDYAGWAQAVFNYVPSDVYDYMPLQPENLEVVTLGDDQYSATINWTNPTQDIHFNSLAAIEPDKKNSLVRVLSEIYAVIQDRRLNPVEGSYTNYLFDKGQDKILKKVGEEAVETVIASKNMNRSDVLYEMGDLWYHCLVLLAFHDIRPEELLSELMSRRTGKAYHEFTGKTGKRPEA